MTTERVILVCGGRDYADTARVFRVLDAARPTRIVHGGAAGADRMAGEWATARGVKVTVYPADWAKHGRAAGPMRNAAMLAAEPSLAGCIAFPGGRGTADMVRRCMAAGVPVKAIKPAHADEATP